MENRPIDSETRLTVKATSVPIAMCRCFEEVVVAAVVVAVEVVIEVVIEEAEESAALPAKGVDDNHLPVL